MVNIKTLLPELKALVKNLAEDLLVRVTADTEVNTGLQRVYQKIKECGRIAQGYEEWREEYLDQVAVAWVLACVFVRFMEDNELIDECWLSGEGDRRKLAEGSYELYFRKHPHDSDREYLKFVFREIRKIPAATELFDEGKTPLWAVDPSGDAAKRVLDYFREIAPEAGGLKRSFRTVAVSTQPIVDVYEKLSPQARFLGDLYQDLSEQARKKYALLQTPIFVEEFILDRTLTVALDQFGLKNLRMIDPTCGSGHFLLGAFDRLFQEWCKPEHGIDNVVVAAQNALDGVWGVDINPFAVAITRFRLLVAAVNACGIKKLHQQSYAWKLHLAIGDSLLWGNKPSYGSERVPISHQANLFDVDPIYAVEDPVALREVLGQSYHVVVGNPPYITVKDKAQNEAYRGLYSTCHRQYSLGVPFTQRFWELAIRQGERISEKNEEVSSGPGYVGMITANSFMKREFGKKLIEEFFPTIDLTQVIDTSGAYIPGHGTPTVILLGRSRKPVGETVRAVLGVKGEPSTPDIPSNGLVWQSILKQIDRANSQDEYTSTAEVSRTTFARHPWSIGGGGANELKTEIENNAQGELSQVIDLIGYICMTRADDLYFVPKAALKRVGFPDANIILLVEGDAIRDWAITEPNTAIFPYDENLKPITDSPESPVIRFLWSYRTMLWLRMEIGGSQKDLGMTWHEWNRFQRERFGHPFCLAFAFVATHNHFVLDRGGKVFKQSAPIVKLQDDATEDDHLGLLGLLNSSTACFWMKQTFHNKGGQGVNEGAKAEHWEKFYEHTGTGLEQFPVAEQKPIHLASQLHTLGCEYKALTPEAMVRTPTTAVLDAAHTKAEAIRGQMIALQEELDWHCYQLYGLLSDDLGYTGNDLPELALGQRAFEIVMARQMAKGELQTTWFERHGSQPITEVLKHWPAAYRKLVERRIKLIETNKVIGLIEKPEYKRRWNDKPWEQQEKQALRNWLLDCLEKKSHGSTPGLTTAARLADKASGNAEFMQVAALYRGRPDFDASALVAELVDEGAVPFLPILRYKPTGLRKRELWERTWELQRQEDAGEKVGEIPVPPKYTSADFQKTDYWRLRGKLDVPKERWISYPHCQTESDPTLVVAWAGWNHLQQATALIAYYDARKREGWSANRLTPLLAGLDQLLPWIHQWHPEIDKEFGETAGQSFRTMLEHDAHELGLTLEEIRNWIPENKPRNTRTTRKKKGESS